VDQLIGCGTSVGANIPEADEALSRPDFRRILGFVNRELSECRFWIRFIGVRGGLPVDRLAPLEQESNELRRVFGSMIARVRRTDQGKSEN
jgi:four helix bundle protein